MGICKFCASKLTDFDAECTICGFNASNESFNQNAARSYYNNSIKNDWIKGIRFVYELNEHLIQRKGFASTNPEKGGWSGTKTADYLGKSNSIVSQQINLAKEIPNYPDLENCKSAYIAIKQLKEIKSGSIPSDIQLEGELQNRIAKEWNKLFIEWELLDYKNQGRYNITDIGEIDLLAEHKTEKGRYLVIELKINQSSDETVGQILRYMGWVKIELAGENGRVEGIIISRSLDRRMDYAMEYTWNIAMKYWMIKEDELFLFDKDEYDNEILLVQLKRLSPEQLNKLLKC